MSERVPQPSANGGLAARFDREGANFRKECPATEGSGISPDKQNKPAMYLKTRGRSEKWRNLMA